MITTTYPRTRSSKFVVATRNCMQNLKQLHETAVRAKNTQLATQCLELLALMWLALETA